MFKRSKNSKAIELANKSEFLFQEVVKETMELHEDLRSEFETIEGFVTEFKEFAAEISDNLDDQQKVRLENFISRLNKVNHYMHKSIRDVSDLLRSQKKILNEIKRAQ